MCVLNPSGLAGCHMFHYFGPPPRQALWGAHMLAGLPSRLLAHPNRPKIDPELPRPDLGNLAKMWLLMVSLPPGAAQPPYLEWTPGRSGPPRPLKPTISGWPKNHVVKSLVHKGSIRTVPAGNSYQLHPNCFRTASEINRKQFGCIWQQLPNCFRTASLEAARKQ